MVIALGAVLLAASAGVILYAAPKDAIQGGTPN